MSIASPTPVSNLPDTSTFEGVFSLLLTPFDAMGSIDWMSYDDYVDWQLSFAPAGLFGVCGSSEMKWLTLDERLELSRRAALRAGSTPVVCTANLNDDPATHREEVRQVEQTGVAGIVLVPPLNVSRDHDTYRDYLIGLAESVSCPVFLYEWPLVSDYLLDPALIRDVAPYITGVKDTTCTMDGITEKIAAAGEAIVYQANTPFMVEALRAGARGIMAITSTSHADLVLALWHAVRAGDDDEEIARLESRLGWLDSLLRWSYPATAKYLVQRRGAPMPLATRWPGDFAPEAVKALDMWFSSGNP